MNLLVMFLTICVVYVLVMTTYVINFSEPKHVPKFVTLQRGDSAHRHRSLAVAARWRSQTMKDENYTRNQTSHERWRNSIHWATHNATTENVILDVVPPIIFDVNSADIQGRGANTDRKDILPNLSGDPTHCARHDNVVFIKTHKTGSTSVSHIVNRYGFHKNLSFVFNRLTPKNGHLVYLPLNADSPRTHFLPPIGVRAGDFSRYKYNMLAVHVRYNRKAMDTFMRPNTHYITILRDPGTQFESAFTHFQLDDSFSLAEKKKYRTMEARIGRFFTKPDFYRRRLKQMTWENKVGLRWYYTKNNQIFDLGLDHVYHSDKHKVKEYIKKLDREFTLVLITEYFEESLVLMRRILCWNMNDILYVAKNVRPHPANISRPLRDKMRQWNDVDSALYLHFNRTLWMKIREYGPSFYEDLAEFRRRLKETFQDCVGGTNVLAQGNYFHWIEYKPRQNASKLCAQIAESKRALFRAIWQKQETKKVNSIAKHRRRKRKRHT